MEPARKTTKSSAKQVKNTDFLCQKFIYCIIQKKDVLTFPMPSPSLANVGFKSVNPDAQIKMLKGKLAEKVQPASHANFHLLWSPLALKCYFYECLSVIVSLLVFLTFLTFYLFLLLRRLKTLFSRQRSNIR